jgi:CheY-like chemotaxis protein
MDSTSPEPPSPSILVVEDDAELRALIALALKQAGHEALFASSGEDALDLMAAAEFDGLYGNIELPGQVDGWEVGTTFSFIWPDKPAVYASAVKTDPPGRLRNGIFLRTPFAMGSARPGVRGRCNCRTSKAAAGMTRTASKNPTGTGIKPSNSFVYGS